MENEWPAWPAFRCGGKSPCQWLPVAFQGLPRRHVDGKEGGSAPVRKRAGFQQAHSMADQLKQGMLSHFKLKRYRTMHRPGNAMKYITVIVSWRSSGRIHQGTVGRHEAESKTLGACSVPKCFSWMMNPSRSADAQTRTQLQSEPTKDGRGREIYVGIHLIIMERGICS